MRNELIFHCNEIISLVIKLTANLKLFIYFYFLEGGGGEGGGLKGKLQEPWTKRQLIPRHTKPLLANSSFDSPTFF